MPEELKEDRFARWMTRLDSYLEELTGSTSADLPEIDFYNLFDHGIPVRLVANDCQRMFR